MPYIVAHWRKHKSAHHAIAELHPMSADRPAGLFGRLLRMVRPDRAAADAAVVRRLAAILSADMVGYSRLMGLDEAGTLAALRSLRRELIDPKIAAHRGRIVKTTGDGLLVEFPSVVDAVQCAIEVQRAVTDHATGEPEAKRITFRIGVNLGEIIFEGGDIYGDGVNIAARLEQLAQPGGVCISHTVYKECRGKIEGAFSDGGDRELKNIAKPVHVWHWQSMPVALIPQTIDAFEGKPSIAVLPFLNMSEDKSQEYFADGMTEDIITGLSCDSRLFVTARNSTFVYKGQPVDIRTVGKELGVRYVLEGSIRPASDRLRITVQLIDTASGNHVWADKIDRPTAEIFHVMDEVVDDLVTVLCTNISVTESNRAKRQRPDNLQAWVLCVQAEVVFWSQIDSKTLLQAEKLAQRAAAIEPGYANSWALLAYMASLRIPFWLSGNLAKDSEEALLLISKALSLAPNDPVVLGYCGYAAIWAGQAGQAVDYLERSLAINPNSSLFRIYYGLALCVDAKPEAGLAQMDQLIRRAPKDPYIGTAHCHHSLCCLALGDFTQAEQSARNNIKHQPGFAWAYIFLAMALAAQGRDVEAKPQMQKVHQLEPRVTRQAQERLWRHVVRKPEDAEKMIALNRQAWGE